MVGKTLAQQDALTEVVPGYFSVKEAVFPFVSFQASYHFSAPDEIDRGSDGWEELRGYPPSDPHASILAYHRPPHAVQAKSHPCAGRSIRV